MKGILPKDMHEILVKRNLNEDVLLGIFNELNIENIPSFVNIIEDALSVLILYYEGKLSLIDHIKEVFSLLKFYNEPLLEKNSKNIGWVLRDASYMFDGLKMICKYLMDHRIDRPIDYISKKDLHVYLFSTKNAAQLCIERMIFIENEPYLDRLFLDFEMDEFIRFMYMAPVKETYQILKDEGFLEVLESVNVALINRGPRLKEYIVILRSFGCKSLQEFTYFLKKDWTFSVTQNGKKCNQTITGLQMIYKLNRKQFEKKLKEISQLK